MAKDQELKSKAMAKTNAKTKNSEESKSKIMSAKPMGLGPMVVLLIFSTAMMILPLGTYFVIRHYIVRSTTIAAMGAIVMVQMIVGAYIYKAYNDENREHEKNLKEKLKKRL